MTASATFCFGRWNATYPCATCPSHVASRHGPGAPGRQTQTHVFEQCGDFQQRIHFAEEELPIKPACIREPLEQGGERQSRHLKRVVLSRPGRKGEEG